MIFPTFFISIFISFEIVSCGFYSPRRHTHTEPPEKEIIISSSEEGEEAKDILASYDATEENEIPYSSRRKRSLNNNLDEREIGGQEQNEHMNLERVDWNNVGEIVGRKMQNEFLYGLLKLVKEAKKGLGEDEIIPPFEFKVAEKYGVQLALTNLQRTKNFKKSYTDVSYNNKKLDLILRSTLGPYDFDIDVKISEGDNVLGLITLEFQKASILFEASSQLVKHFATTVFEQFDLKLGTIQPKSSRRLKNFQIHGMDLNMENGLKYTVQVLNLVKDPLLKMLSMFLKSSLNSALIGLQAIQKLVVDSFL